MGALSVIRGEGPAALIADKLLVTSSTNLPAPGEDFVFGTLERNAPAISALIGDAYPYIFEDELIWGEIVSVEPWVNARPKFASANDQPMVRVTLHVVGNSNQNPSVAM